MSISMVSFKRSVLRSDMSGYVGNMCAPYDFENWFWTKASRDSVSIGLLCPRVVVHSEGCGENLLNIFSVVFAGFDFLANIRESLNDWLRIVGVLAGLTISLISSLFISFTSICYSSRYSFTTDVFLSSLDLLLGVSNCHLSFQGFLTSFFFRLPD